MAPIIGLSHLANPLTSSLYLETSASQLDGVPKDLEESVKFETGRLLQAAGILLRLPQEVIAQAIMILQRFWVGPDGGSLLENDAEATAAAALYLAAKPSAYSQSPRRVLTVFSYLNSIRPDYVTASTSDGRTDLTCSMTDGEYEIARDRLYQLESTILRTLGFQTHVALPYTLCINYLQTLEAFQSQRAGSMIANRAFAHLNSALLNPQLLYLTHQPPALAVASIYLAARDIGVKLPEMEWWEVFDVDREELGFLVVALQSAEGFATEEMSKWGRKKVPLTVLDLQSALERRKMLDSGE